MLPYAYPATYSSTMHSGIYSPSYLIKDPWIEEGCGAVNYVTNDGKARDGAKKYHHGDFNSYFPTIPNWAGEWQFYGPKSSAGDQPPKVVMSKEEYLDDILRNAYKASKAKTKGQNATATALGPYQVHRSYLRSLKKKKLKSFMVRDLIDLPADERHLDASYANLQSMQLLTPPLEPEIAWKNYELSAYENVKPDRIDKSEPYSQYAPCSLTDSLDSSFDPLCDTVHSRLHCITEQDVTSSSDPSITCEPSARTATSPSSDSLEEHSESCSSEVSFCGKSKRIRTIFSCSQLERLEMEFKRSHYMVGAERSQLAAELNLSESQVKVWFQNRRIKHRKQQHEQQQTILSKLKTSQENDSQAEQENNSSTDRALSPSWCENAGIYDRKSRKML